MAASATPGAHSAAAAAARIGAFDGGVSLRGAAAMLLRDVAGFALLAATRALVKAACMAVLPRIVPRRRAAAAALQGGAAESSGSDAAPSKAAADAASTLRQRHSGAPLAADTAADAVEDPSPAVAALVRVRAW